MNSPVPIKMMSRIPSRGRPPMLLPIKSPLIKLPTSTTKRPAYKIVFDFLGGNFIFQSELDWFKMKTMRRMKKTNAAFSLSVPTSVGDVGNMFSPRKIIGLDACPPCFVAGGLCYHGK